MGLSTLDFFSCTFKLNKTKSFCPLGRRELWRGSWNEEVTGLEELFGAVLGGEGERDLDKDIGWPSLSFSCLAKGFFFAQNKE